VAAETPPPYVPYTAKEIADLSSVSYTRVSKLGLDEGQLPFIEESGRRWYPWQGDCRCQGDRRRPGTLFPSLSLCSAGFERCIPA
jgi:hypothetical protein